MPAVDATLLAFALLLSGDAALWRMVWVSLASAVLGLLLAAPPALGLGYLIAMHHFRGRRAAVWLAQAALSVPATLIGMMLYLLLAPRGPLGELAWLHAMPGLVLGQCLLALPLLLALGLAALQALDRRYAETALALGASRLQVMRRVLHECRFGVVAALLAGLGRVMTEAGCALVVGGNIAGGTRSLATAAVSTMATEGDAARAIALGIVLALLALILSGALMLLQGDAPAMRRDA
jgi:tungstate transport system permease protein